MPTVIFGKTDQTISHIPPSRATNPTYKIENLSLGLDDPDRVIAEGNATVAAWTITTSAAAGVDQRNGRKISTAATSDAAIGDVCSIVGPDGDRETFTIKKKATNNYVEAETGLEASYATGSTVYPIELSASFPDDDAADESLLDVDLAVTWTYEIDGKVFSPREAIEFVRTTSSVDAVIGDAETMIRDEYADMPGRLAQGTDFGRFVGRMAARVANDLRRHNRDPSKFMMGPQGVDLVVARVLMHAATHGYAPGMTTPDRRWREETAAAYYALLAAMVSEDPGEGVGVVDDDDVATEIPETTSHSAAIYTVRDQGLDKLRRV